MSAIRSSPAVRDGDPFARIRRGNYLASATLVIGMAAFAVTSRSGWSWGYFLWGVGAGLFAVACVRATMQLMYRGAPADQVARSKQRVRERYSSAYVMTVVFGFGVGTLSASIPSAWPDIALTAFAVMSQMPALAMLPRLRRQAAASPSSPPADG